MKNLNLTIFAMALMMLAVSMVSAASSVTLNSPTSSQTVCGGISADYVFTPIADTPETNIKNCSITVGTVVKWNTTVITNGSQNTIGYSVPSWGAYTWLATCYNTTNFPTASSSQAVNFIRYPCQVNNSESIGLSVLNILKGSVQLLGGIVDRTLDSGYGIMDLAVSGLVLMLAIFVIMHVTKAKKAGERAFK